MSASATPHGGHGRLPGVGRAKAMRQRRPGRAPGTSVEHDATGGVSPIADRVDRDEVLVTRRGDP